MWSIKEAKKNTNILIIERENLEQQQKKFAFFVFFVSCSRHSSLNDSFLINSGYI